MRDPILALKQQLGAELARLMKGWTTSELRFVLLLEQPRISELRRQKLDRFSLESLIRYTDRLRYDVTLTIRPRNFRARTSDAAEGPAGGANGNADIGV